MSGPAPLAPEALAVVLEGLAPAAALLRGDRLAAVNQRMEALVGRGAKELLATPEASALLLPEDRERFLARVAALLRGERPSADMELSGLRGDGAVLRTRVLLSRFPAGGPDAVLITASVERDPGRAAALVRGFVEVATAAQGARGAEEVLRIARERLAALGFSLLQARVDQGLLHLEHADGALAEAGATLRTLYPGGLPVARFPPVRAVFDRGQGGLVDDLPGPLSRALGSSRESLGVQGDLQALVAGIPVDGAVAWGLLAAAPALDESVAAAFGLLGRHLGAAIETARRLEQLARSNAELMAVNHVARASASLEGGDALRSALGRLALTFSIDGIALFRREESALLLEAHEGFPEPWARRARRLPLASGTPWAEAAIRGEPVVFDLEPDGTPPGLQALRTPASGVPRLAPARAAPAPRSEGGRAVAIPLHGSDRVEGVLLATREGSPLTRDDLRLFTTVAAQLAVSLQNALLFEQTRRRVTELSFLLEMGQAAAGSLNTADVLNAGVRVAARGLRCSAAYVFLPEERGEALVCAAAEDDREVPLTGAVIALGRPSLTALAYRSRQTQWSNDVPRDTRTSRDLNHLFEARSALAAPLLSRDAARGVLVLLDRTGRAFDERDALLASHAAQLLATSVENARLYSDQSRRAEEMTLLNEVSRSLAGALELEPLLQTAAAAFGRLVGAQGCLVLLLDPETQRLRFRAAWPARDARLDGIALPLDQTSLPALAARQRRAVLVTDAARSSLVAPELVRALAGETVLAVPLLARDEVVGVLVLEAHGERTFAQAQIERANAVAGQLALAVLSARLFEDLRHSYRELERTQAELIDRERLAALGELSASIAHEVRNPLGVVFNALGSLRRLLKPEGNVGLLLGIIGEEADRLNRMVGDLLDYSRPLQPALQPVPLGPLVAEAIESARASAPPQEGGAEATSPVEVDLAVPAELTLRADQRLLRQALVNLFLNAFQAMPRGGSLRVAAARVAVGAEARARVLIQDTGPGIPPDVQARIFQPFFTTKATGTGLGLAVVKRIVEGHGGQIAVSPRKHGTEFELWLPAE